MLFTDRESMDGLILQLNCNFTDAEKENCIPTIRKIVGLANLARTDGILALELEMEQEPSVFLKTALFLVVNGTDPVALKRILQNMIVADKYSGSQLLDRLLMAEGVLAIGQGENPDSNALNLISILGEKYIVQLKEEIITRNSQSKKIKKYSDFLKTLENKVVLPESRLFETRFLQLDNSSTQLVIHIVDNYYLILALYGCGIKLIHKVFDNVSTNTCLQICENWEIFKPSSNDSIFSAQEKILKVIETQEDYGAICSI